MADLLLEEVKVVNAFLPIDINGAAKNSDYISLENYDAVQIVLHVGAASAASAVTLTQAKEVAGTNTASLDFDYMWACETIGTTNSDTYTKTAVASATFSTAAAGNSIYLIDVRAETLTDLYKCLRINLADPSAGCIVGCTFHLYKARYEQAALQTAIA